MNLSLCYKDERHRIPKEYSHRTMIWWKYWRRFVCVFKRSSTRAMVEMFHVTQLHEHRNALCPKTSYDGQVSQDDGECGILCVWLCVLMTMWLRGHEDGFEHTRWRHGFHLATHTYSDRHATGFQCSAFWQGEYFQTTTCTERCVCVMHMYWL